MQHTSTLSMSCYTCDTSCDITKGVLQCAVVFWSALQCVTVCCSVLQCVTVCCSVLQRRIVWPSRLWIVCIHVSPSYIYMCMCIYTHHHVCIYPAHMSFVYVCAECTEIKQVVIHTYSHIYTCIHVYTRILTHIYTFSHYVECTEINQLLYTFTHTYTRVYMYTQVYWHISIHFQCVECTEINQLLDAELKPDFAWIRHNKSWHTHQTPPVWVKTHQTPPEHTYVQPVALGVSFFIVNSQSFISSLDLLFQVS